MEAANDEDDDEEEKEEAEEAAAGEDSDDKDGEEGHLATKSKKGKAGGFDRDTKIADAQTNHVKVLEETVSDLCLQQTRSRAS